MSKKSKDARIIIGAIVHEGVLRAPLQHIHETSTYFMMETWGDPSKPGNALDLGAQLLSCVESEKHSTNQFRLLIIRSMPESFLLAGIDKFTTKQRGRQSRDEKLEKPAVVVGIDRKSFCRSFVRLWAANTGGDEPAWETQMLASIDSGKSGTVIWVDSKSKFALQTTDILEMRAGARTALGLPIN